MMIGYSVLRAASDRRLAQLAAYWAKEAAGAQTEDERQVCMRMMSKYQGEIERRENNGNGAAKYL